MLIAISLSAPAGLARQQPVAASKSASALSAEEREASDRVSVNTIREVTGTLASDEMQG